MTLTEVELSKEYIISDIATGDSELESFLFSLGCFSGEGITVVSRRKKTLVVAIKDARYCIDHALGECIFVEGERV